MKRFGIVLSLVLVTILLAGSALAQGNNSVYFTTFYANANIAGAPDSTLRIVNDGENSVNPNGTLYASIYVFDDSQELQECCSCPVSADGLLSESVNNQLLANPVTSQVNHVGTINVISSSTQGPTSNTPTPGLRINVGWDLLTNKPSAGVVGDAVNAFLQLSEHPAANSNLTTSHQSELQTLCYYAIKLGSGRGVCSCTPEDYDF